jgi:hypothetical protein
MKLESLHVGMQVRHPQYGLGTVKSISEHAAQIRFNDELKSVEPQTSGLEPAEAQVNVSGLSQPLTTVVTQLIEQVAERLGWERPDAVVDELAARWHGGRFVLHASDPTLQTKEVSLEVFFHKIVMMRNQLRVLEQKLNGHEKLTDEEKFEMQQYITRCYGSMTTFNVLFKNKEGQFTTK